MSPFDRLLGLFFDPTGKRRQEQNRRLIQSDQRRRRTQVLIEHFRRLQQTMTGRSREH